MSHYDKYEQILAQLNEISEEHNKLGKRGSALREQLDKTVTAIMLEENLIQLPTWSIERYGDKIYLKSQGKQANEILQEIMFNCGRGMYHFGLQLYQNVELRFDDNEITMVFKPGVDIAAFIKEHNLTVELPKKIQKEIEAAKRFIKVSEELLALGGSNVQS